ncbi:hypothetical protein GPECTOR_52g5 [Gonium pectorale]|uniref:phytol kinase n=1 Tax=Gonium pectorale TaxID=33097 RepID=A0A150G8G2_GONPE|nr:hypothetical protein GPECTOR_52g5 [Gonium pectorale]|eukprot:KXZ45650.1 hypothetical protein GPECTOR_52g5 [Gonium pectorale]
MAGQVIQAFEQPNWHPGSELYRAVYGPACLPLLGLLAAALRLSPLELRGKGLRQELCREIAYRSATRVAYLVLREHPSPGVLLALLRGDTLHAAGRQLADLAGSPEAVADVAEAATVAVAAAGQSGSAPCTTAEYAAILLNLVYLLIQQSSKACMVSVAPEALQLREALVAALEGSQVLEHAGRALLLLRLHMKGTLDCTLLRGAAFSANTAHEKVADMQLVWSTNGGAGEPLADCLRDVASGRCAQHAALCLGLAVLCDADGGPAYGIPPELLAALPTDLDDSASESGIMRATAAAQLRGMVSMLRLLGGPPPGPRTTLALMLRVGWLAVDSARALAAAGGSGSSGTGGLAAGVPRRIVAAEDVFSVALDAMRNSWFLLPPAGVPESHSLRVADMAGWWRLAAAITADVLPYATPDGHVPALGGMLVLPGGRLLVEHGTLSLPAEPPPKVAAALEGGLLRCLERLMRRAGRDPQSLEAAMLRSLGGLGDRSFWSYLMPLLAYGEPRQAAALVATLRKLLRTVGPRAMLAEWAEWVSSDSSYEGLLQPVFDVLYEARLLDAAGAAPGEGPSPASQQLLRLVSCAACEWLPELARAVLSEEASDALGAAGPIPILNWLQLLSARCASQHGTPASYPPVHQTHGGAAAVGGAEAAAGPGGEAAADDGGEAAAGDDGWRALLLEEVGAVPLLDAALRRLVLPLSGVVGSLWRPYLRCLVDSCCAVAAVYMGPGPPATNAGMDRTGQNTTDEGAAAPVGCDVREVERAAMRPLGTTAAASGSPARQPLPWRPELLREAATHLLSYEEHEAAAKAEVEHLAAYLERGGGGAYQAPVCGRSLLAAALPPPAEARRLLPGRCANPACANLEGDSEADLTLKSCAGCGAVGYCCRPCQLEHWRAGHKGACGRARGGGGAEACLRFGAIRGY